MAKELGCRQCSEVVQGGTVVLATLVAVLALSRALSPETQARWWHTAFNPDTQEVETDRSL